MIFRDYTEPVHPIPKCPITPAHGRESTLGKRAQCLFIPKEIRSVFPSSSFSNPSDNIYQSQQDRNLDQWSNGRGKSLVTIRAKSCNCDSNGQFEVIAGGGKALSSGKFVTEAQLVCNQQGKKEDDDEVHNKWSSDSDNRDNLMDHLVTLRRE
jgi:hypothetical protein